MTPEWSPLETGRHQDHVIAHVIGATALGFFVTDGALHVLLDIGFIWTIYSDGEMALMPQGVAVSELDVDEDVKRELAEDVERLSMYDGESPALARFAPVQCLIREVSFYARGTGRRIVLESEAESLAVESSLETGEMRVLQIL